MNTWEFPLVLFTVIGQWAIGLALMITLIEVLTQATSTETSLKQVRIGGMLVFPLTFIALLCSIFHLGQPLSALRALSHLGVSQLSMEILFFTIVAVLALVYSLMWWKTPNNISKTIVGGIFSIVGVVAVVVSSNVYTLPARLSWDSWQTSAAFLLTAVLLGAVTLTFLLRKSEEKTSLKAKKILGYMILASAFLIVIVLSAFAQTSGASHEQTVAVANTFASIFFPIRLLLGILLPVAFASLLIANKIKSCTTFSALTLAGVLVGEVAGRILFYSAVMSQAPWF
jgi:anaerobic dimethyl sulfoxide reductase subunit C